MLTRFTSLALLLGITSAACSSGSPNKSSAADSAGGAAGSAGASGSASGSSGSSGTGAAGANGGSAGTGTAGSAGTGTAGTSGSVGTAGSAGSSGAAGTSGAGAAGTSGAGAAGTSGAGTAGTSGAAGSSGSAGTGGAASPCAISGKILCDDFESEAVGALPTGSPWAPLNCFASGYTLKVDSGAAHSGAHSFLGENIPYADCQLHADLGTGLSEYWVRAWVYYGGAAPTSATHEVSVFELVPAASTDDPSIRIGYRGDTCMPVGVELNITGGGQEETGCTGSVPAANTWYCYVLHVNQAASSVTADLSINGVDQSYTNHGNAQMQITSQVAAIRYLRLGPRSYSGTFANPIYVDDVAVATQALGCN